MKVDEAYNLWAESYDSNENLTRDLELIAGKSILGDRNFSKIIELGCGTGKNTEWLIEKCDSLVHHISDYLVSANMNNFKLLELKEWFDDEEKYGLPRLVSFLFEKE